jgi:HAD superfamily hydrolase (TIGR01509 family)
MAGAVLFDIDGTLVDSNYLHITAWLEAFRSVGRQVATSSIHRCMGMDSAKMLEQLLGDDAGTDVGEKAKAEHKRRYLEAQEHLAPFTGATELVREVARRATAVLATSAPADELEILRRVLDIDDAIEVVTSAADVKTAKPSPDVVSVALERAGVDPDHAVFVGDTVWDVEAAGRAGVSCVGVLTGGISAAELLDAGAVEVYDDATDLLEHLDSSALARVFG